MTTIAPMTPKNSQPTTDPMIHAAFFPDGRTWDERLAMSMTPQRTNARDAT